MYFSKAVLFDRQSLAITLGTINDEFVRNMVTVLGEVRAGFGVIRPAAFVRRLWPEALEQEGAAFCNLVAMSSPPDPNVPAYYERGGERDRLEAPLGQLEFVRTQEILRRHLPATGATIADIGGGAGQYSVWLAGEGYRVLHRDIMPLHVEQAAALAAERGVALDAEVSDARSLDISDASVDSVLMLGPLYHITDRNDRLSALREARRVVRPGGIVFIAAISRWAPLLDGIVVKRIDREYPEAKVLLESVETTGVLPALFPGDFSGFCHRPDQLSSEATEVGLACLDLVNVEGLAFALLDLEERWRNAEDRERILDAARRIERVPELLGLGPHLVLTAAREARIASDPGACPAVSSWRASSARPT